MCRGIEENACVSGGGEDTGRRLKWCFPTAGWAAVLKQQRPPCARSALGHPTSLPGKTDVAGSLLSDFLSPRAAEAGRCEEWSATGMSAGPERVGPSSTTGHQTLDSTAPCGAVVLVLTCNAVRPRRTAVADQDRQTCGKHFFSRVIVHYDYPSRTPPLGIPSPDAVLRRSASSGGGPNVGDLLGQ